MSDAGLVGSNYTDQYNTQLPAGQEAQFQAWRQGLPPDLQNLRDYDLRGAFLANVQEASNGHLPDTFKKPNHPTFSTGSKYSQGPMMGGTWVDMGNGKWGFHPSPTNLQYSTPYLLKDYFSRVEPKSQLFLPGETAFDRTFKK